jgi:hypothetical protein
MDFLPASGTNVGFFKTVLDAPGDKTSGEQAAGPCVRCPTACTPPVGTRSGCHHEFCGMLSSTPVLTAGCIYVAKFTQTDAANGGSFDISWIEMGCATDAELKVLSESGQ